MYCTVTYTVLYCHRPYTVLHSDCNIHCIALCLRHATLHTVLLHCACTSLHFILYYCTVLATRYTSYCITALCLHLATLHTVLLLHIILYYCFTLYRITASHYTVLLHNSANTPEVPYIIREIVTGTPYEHKGGLDVQVGRQLHHQLRAELLRLN